MVDRRNRKFPEKDGKTKALGMVLIIYIQKQNVFKIVIKAHLQI